MTIQPPLIPAPPKPTPDPSAHPYAWATGGGWRHAAPTRCRRCRAHTIRGLDADQCAFTAVVDIAPLDVIGEALALLAGQRTCTLTAIGATLTLTRRGRRQIPAMPAGAGRYDVLAAHACHAAPLPGLPSRIQPPVDRADPDSPPPF